MSVDFVWFEHAKQPASSLGHDTQAEGARAADCESPPEAVGSSLAISSATHRYVCLVQAQDQARFDAWAGAKRVSAAVVTTACQMPFSADVMAAAELGATVGMAGQGQGLGDRIADTLSRLGFRRPCAACAARQGRLNQLGARARAALAPRRTRQEPTREPG